MTTRCRPAYVARPLPTQFMALCDAMGDYGETVGGAGRKSLASLVRAMTTCTDSAAIVRTCLRLCGPRTSDMVRGQAVVWCAEWHWLHGVPLDASALPWPTGTRLRLRLLTTCLNGGHVPPIPAWHWLRGGDGSATCGTDARVSTVQWQSDCGGTRSGASVPYGLVKRGPPSQSPRNWDDAWSRTWKDFCATMRGGARRACAVPYCALVGTRMADTLDAVLPNWTGDNVRAFFRCAWTRCRRTGRETASRLEDDWWRMVRGVFPGSEPERHAPLPGGGMHLDVFWPRERVALEVQGEPHWQSVGMFGGAAGLAKRQERDARKRTLCAELGIRLVEVTRHTGLDDVCALLQQMATTTCTNGEKSSLTRSGRRQKRTPCPQPHRTMLARR